MWMKSTWYLPRWILFQRRQYFGDDYSTSPDNDAENEALLIVLSRTLVCEAVSLLAR